MSDLSNWLSIAAALVSAVGGCFAARAAFLSARSARDSQAAADEAERRATRRAIAIDASAVVAESKRVAELSSRVIQAQRRLAVIHGGVGSPRLDLYAKEAEARRGEVEVLAKAAQLFTDGASSLRGSPPDDLDRVLLQQQVALKATQKIREQLEREEESIERQRLQMLESMDRTRLGK
jgi:signal recognition particle GTPase